MEHGRPSGRQDKDGSNSNECDDGQRHLAGREKTVNGKAPNQYTWNVSCLNTGGNGIGMI